MKQVEHVCHVCLEMARIAPFMTILIGHDDFPQWFESKLTTLDKEQEIYSSVWMGCQLTIALDGGRRIPRSQRM